MVFFQSSTQDGTSFHFWVVFSSLGLRGSHNNCHLSAMTVAVLPLLLAHEEEVCWGTGAQPPFPMAWRNLILEVWWILRLPSSPQSGRHPGPSLPPRTSWEVAGWLCWLHAQLAYTDMAVVCFSLLPEVQRNGPARLGYGLLHPRWSCLLSGHFCSLVGVHFLI